MKVFRLEDNNGQGVYRVPATFDILADLHCSPDDRPLPCHDKELSENFSKLGIDAQKSFNNSFVFCFESPDQLIRWFPFDTLFQLGSAGVIVSIYESDTVVRGVTQCAIPKTDHKDAIKKMQVFDFLTTYI